MTKFKPGDVVERTFLGSDDGRVQRGGVYTVEDVNPTPHPGWIKLVGITGTWNTANFKLVTQEPKAVVHPRDIKPGSRVRVTFEIEVREVGIYPDDTFWITTPQCNGEFSAPAGAKVEVLEEPRSKPTLAETVRRGVGIILGDVREERLRAALLELGWREPE